jgi:S-adenosylmethionine:tRNA ribosyltransferase-isomerase
VSVALAAPAAPERREAHEPPEQRGLARDEVRMLVAARAAGDIEHARARELPAHLRPGDLLVVNTSATLPAALEARRADGTALVLHLSTPDAAAPPPQAGNGGPVRWTVELRRGGERFSAGRAGETLALAEGARATLLAPYLARAAGTRLWLAELDTGPDTLLPYLRRHGAPIRYGYVARELPLADYQTIFAREPGSAEMPSAGRPFTPQLVTDLVSTGIAIAPLTLHTGVSSLEAGEAPYPEQYAVPAPTAWLVNATRAGGGRVIAVGTTVVRALETAAAIGAATGEIEPAAGWTRHLVTPQGGVRAVDGLLTGWHDPDASHLLMLEAIGGAPLVETSYAEALRAGYRWHEFGDLHLIVP